MEKDKQSILFFRFKYCCFAKQVDRCWPPADEFSSCEHMIDNRVRCKESQMNMISLFIWTYQTVQSSQWRPHDAKQLLSGENVVENLKFTPKYSLLGKGTPQKGWLGGLKIIFTSDLSTSTPLQYRTLSRITPPPHLSDWIFSWRNQEILAETTLYVEKLFSRWLFCVYKYNLVHVHIVDFNLFQGMRYLLWFIALVSFLGNITILQSR